MWISGYSSGSGAVWIKTVVATLAPLVAVVLFSQAHASINPTVVVTTSLIESAVVDVSAGTVETYRMIPPGACPGHYDVSPRDLQTIASSAAVFRHDYQEYIDCQQRVSDLFRDKTRWTRMSILNTAQMGKFSSDRSILDYSKKIWDVSPFPVKLKWQKIPENGVLFSPQRSKPFTEQP